MRETFKRDWKAKIALFFLFLFAGWWFGMQIFLPQDHMLYSLYGKVYGVMALWGGICGLSISRTWGGTKSIMGKAILMFSLGLFSQVFGQIAYSYYIFVLNVEIPFPSVGDIGFFGTIPFYIYGAILLAKASGVKLSFKSIKTKVQVLLIPLIMLVIAYTLFLKDYTLDLSTPLTTFLTFGYPLGQAIYLTIGILTYSLTRNLLGGVMKERVLFIIIAFGAQFLADYLFLYFQTDYFPGSYLDYLYFVSYFLMTMGILQLKTTFDRLREA
jgi:hypothetical protein